MRIVIPMSGIGKRFIDAGYKEPKPLIEVEGRPIIGHVISLFPGEKNFDFICNDRHLETTNMYNVLERQSQTININIYSVSVENRKGPVDAVLQIENDLPDDEEIIVSYCDYGTQWNYQEFLKQMRDNNADGGIASYIGFHPHMLGSDNYAFMKHQDMWVTDIQEKKPFTDNKMEEYASNGTYYFRSGALMKKYFQRLVDLKMDLNGEYYVSLVYKLMCEDGLRTRIFEIEKMLQWGTPKDLQEYTTWSDYFYKHYKNPMDTLPVQAGVTTILPMAGAGSRFKMVGYDTPKPLLPVHDKPMFVEAINCLPPSERVIVVCQKSHLEQLPIVDIVKKSCNGTVIPIDYVTEGQACTCEIAIKEAGIPLDKPILISACDNGAYYDQKKYLTLVENKDIDVIVWAFTNNPTGQLYPEMYAWLDVDVDGRINDVSIKKPFVGKPNTHAIIGTMFFRTGALFMEGLQDIYRENNRTNGEFYVDNVLQPLIKKGYRVQVFEVDYYLCWGTPNDYKTYLYWDEYFKKRNINTAKYFPKSGLGDRILELFMLSIIANIKKQTIHIFWQEYYDKKTHDIVPSWRFQDTDIQRFLDFFKITPRFIFHKIPHNTIIPYDKFHTDYFMKGCVNSPSKFYDINSSIPLDVWNALYNYTKSQFGLKVPDYSAEQSFVTVHLRRTDKLNGNDFADIKITELEHLNNETMSAILRAKEKGFTTFFLASDDINARNTYNDFLKNNGLSSIQPENTHSLIESYYDIWVMKSSSLIIQSMRYSTFSLFPALLWNIPLWTVLDDSPLFKLNYNKNCDIKYYKGA